jgi:transcription elongation GreA/GreB family factor
LYLCCPIFAEAMPGLTGREEILAAVSARKLTDRTLDALYQVAMSEQRELERRVGF